MFTSRFTSFLVVSFFASALWCLGIISIGAAEPAAPARASSDRAEEINRLIDQIHADVAAVRRETAARPKTTLDSGIAGSKNFTVLAPRGEHLAEEVLERAEALRKEIALLWLGEELSPGTALTHITLWLDDKQDRGTTLLCGPGRAFRGDHRMWLTTSRERALGSTLAHEITHVVLAGRFPRGMPAWANEGIASMQDDAERAEQRRELLSRFVREDRWPALSSVLQLPAISPDNQAAYAVSVSLTEHLLSRGSREQLLKFVEQGAARGWDAALRESYGLADVDALEREWKTWVKAHIAP